MVDKQQRSDVSKMLIEFKDAMEHVRAKKVLQACKEKEGESEFITVYIDEKTVKLMTLDKIKKKKLEIIKVKLSNGRLVFMEKDNAIKKGYINE